jgi:hypothetical protein
VEPVSLAFDRATGTAAIAFPIANEDGVNLAVSRDRGRTWTVEHFQAGLTTGALSTALALHQGKFHLAANMENAGPVYITGAIGAQAASWTSQQIPPAGQQHHDHSNVALALDRDARPWIAFADTAAGGGVLYAVWRPGLEGAVKVADSASAREDFPDVALAIAGGRFNLLFTARLDGANPDAGVWFSASATATEWSLPVRIPAAGPRASNHPIALAAGLRGAIAASFGSVRGDGPSPCAYPQTALSADDGVTWRTCGVTEPAERNPVEPQPQTVRAAYAGNGKLFVLAHAGDESSGHGLFLWRQP